MNWQAQNINPNHRTDDTAWYLLTEFSLKEFLSDRSLSGSLMTGFLSLPRQELDTLPKWEANVETLLSRFANDLGERIEPGGLVRVFCQRKIIDDIYLEREASQIDTAEQRMKRAQAILDPSKKLNGGWGYYAIEKGRDFTGPAGKASGAIIEIYIYRESIDTP